MIKGVKVANQIEITHVLFVDDVLMFGDGTFSNIQNLVKVLKSYQRATRMEINLEKSKLYQNCINEEVLTKERELIPMPISPLNEGFKYLGFKLKPNAYSSQDWVWLYKKIESRVSMWTNRFLSRGG